MAETLDDQPGNGGGDDDDDDKDAACCFCFLIVFSLVIVDVVADFSAVAVAKVTRD